MTRRLTNSRRKELRHRYRLDGPEPSFDVIDLLDELDDTLNVFLAALGDYADIIDGCTCGAKQRGEALQQHLFGAAQ